MNLFLTLLCTLCPFIFTSRVSVRNSSALFPLIGTSAAAAGAALFSPEVLEIETPIAIRYALIVSVVAYNAAAPCDRAALSFLGEREALSQKMCADKEVIADLNVYSTLRSIELEFPEQAAAYAQVMKDNGIDPTDRSIDKNTGVGFGNAAGIRVAEWFGQDGWNSLGDKSRGNYAQPFEDFTNYKPVNSPNSQLEFSLDGWQPLTQTKHFGRFDSQVLVVPFLGSCDPLVLTDIQVQSKRAPPPYHDINSTSLSRSDASNLDKHIAELFKIPAGLTKEQRVLARFWNNKFISVGGVAIGVLGKIQVNDALIVARWVLGEMMALHDAIIIAWKEKRRFDAVRPPTAIRDRYKGRKVRAYVPAKGKVMMVAAEDWEPLIPVQPHSEYPSASAIICGASFEHAKFIRGEALKQTNSTTAFPFTIRPIPGAVDSEGFTELSFRTFDEASESCGVSRLWASMHFSPSIPAGAALSKDTERLAYEHVRDLANGKVPSHCTRCTFKI
eukprot:Plantae.Rhodophyta-Hildenbrandia_rubra.ctg403.p1 GENE.Plantae.Rhodophyta-Hildenbrandia_rubra.ctg403~~Plantae.Rhodophyta-Hildenbrandia_rubra.ctg403.p1  ORF type:complete len:501 (-),score=56.32 Plantae.Rhodophyta-Hildenbrandia_rubra.ctg403:451-1953(-)